jgi:hypothetical protein
MFEAVLVVVGDEALRAADHPISVVN